MQFKSDSINKLALALSKAQSKIDAAIKSSENPHYRSKYSDLSEVWNVCKKALGESELAVIQAPVWNADGQFLDTTICHSSGEWVTGRFLLKPTKPDMQGMGSAITYARRYSLAAMVGVVQDDDDGNAASEPKVVQLQSKKPTAPLPPPPPTQQDKAGYNPENPAHVRVLKTRLAQMKITGTHYDNVISAMPGKSLNDLENIIKLCDPSAPDREP